MLQRPAFTVFALEKLVRDGGIRELHAGAVPQQPFGGQLLAHLRAKGDVAQQDDFGERAGPVEVGAGGGAAFAGFDPFVVVADRARQRLGRIAVLLGPRIGNQSK